MYDLLKMENSLLRNIRLDINHLAHKFWRILGVSLFFLIATTACHSSDSNPNATSESATTTPMSAENNVDKVNDYSPKATSPKIDSHATQNVTTDSTGKIIVVSEKEKNQVIQFLYSLYGLNEYQGFMFVDLDFVLPHCTEKLLQKLQNEESEEEEYDINYFRTPAEKGNGINVLTSVDYQSGNTYIVKYIDLGHEAVSEIDAYVISGKVLMDDVRLVSWNKEVYE